jgi:hypothetical protein
MLTPQAAIDRVVPDESSATLALTAQRGPKLTGFAAPDRPLTLAKAGSRDFAVIGRLRCKILQDHSGLIKAVNHRPPAHDGEVS